MTIETVQLIFEIAGVSGITGAVAFIFRSGKTAEHVSKSLSDLQRDADHDREKRDSQQRLVDERLSKLEMHDATVGKELEAINFRISELRDLPRMIPLIEATCRAVERLNDTFIPRREMEQTVALLNSRIDSKDAS